MKKEPKTRKKVKKEPKVIEMPMSGFAQTASEGDDYFGADLRFYTKGYSITIDDKKMLVSLVGKAEFRVFEKYLDWRVNASAHRMKSLLITGKKDEAAAEAAGIEALVKITQDMFNYYQEVKMLDSDDEILLKEKEEKAPKTFGKDRFSLNLDTIDEAERI